SMKSAASQRKKRPPSTTIETTRPRPEVTSQAASIPSSSPPEGARRSMGGLPPGSSGIPPRSAGLRIRVRLSPVAPHTEVHRRPQDGDDENDERPQCA